MPRWPPCSTPMTEPGSGFATRFDHEPEPLPVPGVVSTGGDAALQLTDGLIRQRAFLARVTTSSAIVGIKVASTGPLRVEVALSSVATEPRPNLVEVRTAST